MSREARPLPPDPLIGQCLGDYRIERQLGRGGMGVVYLAQHVQLQRPFALKLLRSDSLDESRARERFLREAQALARVKAPGLVDILAVGETPDGVPYIVMEYLHGQTLRQRLVDTPQHRLPLSEALLLAEQLATTLDQLHQKQVIHRDLKPENVMLVADDAVPGGERTKLLDLGIAKLLDEVVPLTRTEHQPGTQPYMSPEACAGDRSLDGKADVYSLGCVLYELLCGRPPFAAADGGNLMIKHLQQRPQSPRIHVPTLPPAIEHFVLDLLEKDPSARPNASDAVRRLQSLRQKPQTAVSLITRWRRRPGGAPLALRVGMPLLALLALLLFSMWKIGWPPFRPTNMVLIPGGTYVRGTSLDIQHRILEQADALDRQSSPSEAKDKYRKSAELSLKRELQDTVTVRWFWIDQYEVTFSDFARYLNNGLASGEFSLVPCRRNIERPGQKPPSDCVYTTGPRTLPLQDLRGNTRLAGLQAGADNRVLVRAGFEQRPAVAMSWYAAKQYCETQGRRLPTQEEWEFTASNGKTTLYPWGDLEPSCEHAALERQLPTAPLSPELIFSACRRIEDGPYLPLIGSLPKDRNRWQVYDLGGGAQEWTSSLFTVIGGTEVTEYVLRGGAWNSDRLMARAASVSRAAATDMMSGVGFRCAKDR